MAVESGMKISTSSEISQLNLMVIQRPDLLNPHLSHSQSIDSGALKPATTTGPTQYGNPGDKRWQMAAFSGTRRIWR